MAGENLLQVAPCALAVYGLRWIGRGGARARRGLGVALLLALPLLSLLLALQGFGGLLALLLDFLGGLAGFDFVCGLAAAAVAIGVSHLARGRVGAAHHLGH